MFTNVFKLRPTRIETAQQLSASSGSDESAFREAILQVVSIWLNRLSLVSGIASFFSSIDSLLFSLASTSTHLGDPDAPWSATDKLTTASFAGALIFHVCSAILAFVASFILVRLELIDADDQEDQVADGTPASTSRSTMKATVRDLEQVGEKDKHVHRPSTSSAPVADTTTLSDTSSNPSNPVYARITVSCFRPLSTYTTFVKGSKGVMSPANPNDVADAILNPPIQLLSRCHSLAVWMSAIGFILGVVGILAYAWVATPAAVSIFTTVCLGVCLATMVFAII
ncbi:uncharacterized protein B0H18DRAFT_1121638 [Fomitopsis serialis]|uniref:uncharacterized protein n=1 Tax=Fomitopsis serialis TaxID=139415 RepID=UPI002007A69B|nr:uncharacterized protein B0H18DRAFT_1121638 [Neoantrodia serialis]KAH9920910.1 hypothetical protein B0H18DRAFT_1121638 [Neoantrodia serialis]